MSTRTWEGLTIPAAGTFDLDVQHTRIGFWVKHMMVSKVRGHFNEFSGSVTIAEDPMSSSASLTIKTVSIDTASPDRDAHLKGDDFLSVEKFPEITFRSTRVTGHSGDELTLLGDLTIHDIAKEVELKVEFGGVGTNPWGMELFGFSISTEFDREDFGLTWNKGLETGGVLIGKTVKVEIEGEAVRA
jgi:Uncharacterized conserved protein